jgi:hypothetical protein
VGVIGALQAQMALAVLAGLEPDPLGQLVSFDALGCRFGGFRFDGAPEPEGGFHFIAATDIRASDALSDLRGAEESGPTLDGASRRSVPDFDTPPLPENGQRAVLACRSGLRAWQAATRLRKHWPGEIALIALGDSPNDTQGDE